MSTVMPSNRTQQLRTLVGSSADPLWWPVLQRWLERFDGWWLHDREETRDPAWAMIVAALTRTPLRQDAHRNALFLARLPFNRWHAVTVDGRVRWNPLEQSFSEYVDAVRPAPVVSFLAPDFEDARLNDTSRWLWSMWQVEHVRHSRCV
jgi:hypothetical protein